MRDEINEGLKAAVKQKDTRRINTLRLINAAIKDRDISVRTEGRAHVEDSEILGILTKMVKQREDSEKIYQQAGRIELATQEREELEIIQEFLPKQMDCVEMNQAIDAAIEITESKSLRDMGKCMAHLKQNYPGRMDFSKASAEVKARLSA